MLQTDKIAEFFAREGFASMTFTEDKQVLLKFGGCGHGECAPLFDSVCDSVRFVAYEDQMEVWRLAPRVDCKDAVISALIEVWHRVTGAAYEAPRFTYSNAHQEGWGDLSDRSTLDQSKTVINLLVTGHKVRLYPWQEWARSKGYGMAYDTGYIAIQVDRCVLCVSPTGYLCRCDIPETDFPE